MIFEGGTRPIRVLVVDDQQLLRRGLTLLLGTHEDVEVVAGAANGVEALGVLARTPVDVVLTDAKMPGLDGIGLVRECARQYPEISTLVLTTFDEPELVKGAIGEGASGFLLKDSSTEDIVDALKAAVAGGMVVDPRVARMAYEAVAGASERSESPLMLLTRSERSVAELVSQGMSNQEIAGKLHLAEGTVKNLVSALLRKLDARDRTVLALELYKMLSAEHPLK